MNILITAAGRRSYLIHYFKEALQNKGKIIAANSIDHVPSFAEADETVVTPISYDPNYIPFLLNYCSEKKIDAILSLYDVDLGVLARSKEAFDRIGTKLIVSDEEFIRICNDKWATYMYLTKNGFKTPRTYLRLADAKKAILKNEITYPVIVKPRFGNGSIALNVASNEQELDKLFEFTQNEVKTSWLRFESADMEDIVIVQEFLNGPEYGIDIINDLDGHFCNVSIKKKIAMRSGETDSAIIEDNESIKREVTRLGEISGHIANLDCDGFLVGDSFYILEMNARFGGGYPFSHIAGVNLPLAIIKWLNGERVDTSLLTPEVGVEAYKDIEIKKWNK